MSATPTPAERQSVRVALTMNDGTQYVETKVITDGRNDPEHFVDYVAKSVGKKVETTIKQHFGSGAIRRLSE